MTIRMTLATALLATALLPAAAAAPGETGRRRGPPRRAAAAPPRSTSEPRARPATGCARSSQQYPPSVGQVLRLDPSLLTKPDYMAPYPVAGGLPRAAPGGRAQPGVLPRRRAVQRPATPTATERGGAARSRTCSIGLEVLIGVMTGDRSRWRGWLRAAIDHRRWLRATKIQTDAHTKIVDRLSSNEDLLAYMQSPTGQRFLTASLGVPAAADARRRGRRRAVQPHPLVGPGRHRRSPPAGLGLWLAKNGVIDEAAQPLQVVSILAMALGIGFVASAFASYVLSRQLGLVQPHAAPCVT